MHFFVPLAHKLLPSRIVYIFSEGEKELYPAKRVNLPQNLNTKISYQYFNYIPPSKIVKLMFLIYFTYRKLLNDLSHTLSVFNNFELALSI